jgi:hypothetical protein
VVVDVVALVLALGPTAGGTSGNPGIMTGGPGGRRGSTPGGSGGSRGVAPGGGGPCGPRIGGGSPHTVMLPPAWSASVVHAVPCGQASLLPVRHCCVQTPRREVRRWKRQIPDSQSQSASHALPNSRFLGQPRRQAAPVAAGPSAAVARRTAMVVRASRCRKTPLLVAARCSPARQAAKLPHHAAEGKGRGQVFPLDPRFGVPPRPAGRGVRDARRRGRRVPAGPGFGVRGATPRPCSVMGLLPCGAPSPEPRAPKTEPRPLRSRLWLYSESQT